MKLEGRNHLLCISLVCWMYFRLFVFYLMMTTGLLICMENTFWTISRDDDFVELFKKSFTSYASVESGTRKKTEAKLDLLLRNRSGYSATNEFKAEFCTFIIENCLRKFHCSICTFKSNYFLWINLKLLDWNKKEKNNTGNGPTGSTST